MSWAKLISQDISLAYTSLNDGKTPLFFWLLSSASQLTHNTWWTARFISVIMGAITSTCWSIVTYKIFGRKTAIMLFGMFLLVPYAYFIERLGITDSMLTAFTSIAVLCFFASQTSKRFSFVFSLMAGVSFSLAYMTKTSALLFLLIITLLSSGYIFWSLLQKKWKATFAQTINLILMLAIYHELVTDMRVGAMRFWSNIQNKETELTFTPFESLSTLVHHPLIYWHSMIEALSYFFVYLGPLLIFFAFGIYFILKLKLWRKYLWILIYIGLGLAGITLAAKIPASRYFYPLVPAILVISAYGFVRAWECGSLWLKKIILISVFYLVLESGWLVFFPQTFPFPGNDIQIKTGDVSAYGLTQIVSLLKPQAADSVVAVNGIWGVSDGSVIVLQEAGIHSFVIPKLEETSDLDALKKRPEAHKYVFATRSREGDVLAKKFKELRLIGAYTKSRSLKTYLYEILL